MSTLRVAHVITTPGLGGVPVVVRALVRHRPSDVEPFVYALSPGTGDAATRGLLVDQLEAAGATVRIADVPHRLAVIDALAAWMEHDRIDVVHTHSYKPNLWGRLAAGLVPRGARHPAVVAHYHNTYDDKWGADGTLALDRRLLAATDAVVACSAAVADHVAERLGCARSTVNVIPNGVDLDRCIATDRGAVRSAVRSSLAPGLDDGEPLIGVIGRLGRQKAQDVAVDALVVLTATYPAARLVLVGTADHAEDEIALRRRVTAAGLADRVHFAGYRTDIATVLAGIDVVAMPSRWEGFGLVAVEALAAGTPLVVSDVPALREVTADGAAAAIVAPDDPVALARGFADLLDHPDPTAARRTAGLALAREWSWARAAADVGALHSSLASEVAR